MGVHYIIAEALYEKLPAEEKAYWHPHNYEPGVADNGDAAARPVPTFGMRDSLPRPAGR